jgi:hypothetical protein
MEAPDGEAFPKWKHIIDNQRDELERLIRMAPSLGREVLRWY